MLIKLRTGTNVMTKFTESSRVTDVQHDRTIYLSYLLDFQLHSNIALQYSDAFQEAIVVKSN